MVSSWRRLLLATLPSTCIVCARYLTDGSNLCLECSQELPWIESACNRCGNASLNLPLHHGVCGACRLRPQPFRRCLSLFHYRSPVDSLVAGFKFNARFDIGYALALLLANRMHRYYAEHPRPDLLIPVPLSRARLRERGYNQALEITRVVAKHLRLPVCATAVLRTRDTLPQSQLHSSHSRRRNLRQAFQIGPAPELEGVRYVAVLDDVVTTTATVSECCRALGGRGIATIDLWCLARTGH